ncbi:MAG: hypothetical protein KIT09_17575 [Bryobacteraceae bacterium]|nr:hypothetical protein [Bryobacteraceae bacterium]
MAPGMKLEVPVDAVLCESCKPHSKALPPEEGVDYFARDITLPGGVTVPVEVRDSRFSYKNGAGVLNAIIALPCPDCGASRDSQYSLEVEIPEAVVRGRRCPKGHPLALESFESRWEEREDGPWMELRAEIVCPICRDERQTTARMAAPPLSALRGARRVELDFAANAVSFASEASPAPDIEDAGLDFVPVPAEITDEPFQLFPMLRWVTRTLSRNYGRVFSGLRGAFVLHYLSDLLPFAEGCRELGLEPRDAVLFYKSEYRYPHKQAIARWLSERGFQLRPVEQTARFVAEQEAAWRPGAPPWIIVEDGGYLTPLLHQRGSNLLQGVVGAIEQTTKGLRKTEDWTNLAGGPGAAQRDGEGLLQFPLLSIPDSRIKLKVEPPLIGQQVVHCIQALTTAVSLQGLRVALLGLGTIGMEVFSRLHSLGALVDGYDGDVSRVTEFRMKGGNPARSAAEAVRGKRLVIGCSGRQSITADVIANLEHGVWLASASSDLVEIDLAYLESVSNRHFRIGIQDQRWEPGKLWAGTRHILAGSPAREINLLADGYPVTFWGFPGMPHQGGDLIMSVILVAAAALAARNGPSAADPAARFPARICRQAVDDLGREFDLQAQYLRIYFPDARA